MIVKTAWPALIPAIKKAGHIPLLVTEAQILAQHPSKESEPSATVKDVESLLRELAKGDEP
jgi:hypothetical protein